MTPPEPRTRHQICRCCGLRITTTDGLFPAGWIVIRRYPGNLDTRPELIGLLCDNIYCLHHHVDALVDDYERAHPPPTPTTQADQDLLDGNARDADEVFAELESPA